MDLRGLASIISVNSDYVRGPKDFPWLQMMACAALGVLEWFLTAFEIRSPNDSVSHDLLVGETLFTASCYWSRGLIIVIYLALVDVEVP